MVSWSPLRDTSVSLSLTPGSSTVGVTPVHGLLDFDGRLLSDSAAPSCQEHQLNARDWRAFRPPDSYRYRHRSRGVRAA